MEKVAQWRASCFVLITRYYQAVQIKENEVGGACGTHGRGKKPVESFGGKARRKKPLERPDVGGRMGSKWTLRGLAGGVEWIYVAQDRDRLRAVVNAVMKPRILAPRI
jgi:hypothetical protein